jgi:uncharacterized membrane-anchored protein
MAEFVKWWKDKLIVAIMLTAVLSVIVAFLFAYFIEWGWILSIITAIAGGITMRKLAIKKINEWVNSK